MGKLKGIFFIGILTIISLPVYGQKGTQSPYSVFGLGELNSGEYAYFMAMGGASTANTDSTIVNINNPASYSYISRYRPLFQIGLNGKFITLIEGDEQAKQNQIGLNQFQLGFPISKKWGGSIGLTPFSTTGYNIVNNTVTDNDTVSQFINEGEGTISNFHFGTGYKHTLSSKSSLAIGVNANYLFGSSNKIESFEYSGYPELALHSRVENKTRVSSFNFDLGLIYEQNVGTNSFSLGLKYTPSIKLKANQDLLSYSYSESYYGNYSYGLNLVDTTEYIFENEGIINLPEAYSIGFEYRIRGKEQLYLLKLVGDIKIQKWSEYYEEFDNTQTNPIFKDRIATSFGLQYTPHIGINGNNNMTPLLSRLHYRVGFNYTLSQLYLNNTQLTDYGISFGLGIPVMNNNSNTNLNLGVKLGSLGRDSGLITENYTGIYLGVTISPGLYDRWFLKRKYD
jgi:hypothetical protein